ncbi:uncharacterized protein [Nicotiana tomentosiformis]|uniref:uncharacterized protein n=1 Tax=Nicotiana tomentosiformis TaxID=4098 RepID=UPI00388C6F9A
MVRDCPTLRRGGPLQGTHAMVFALVATPPAQPARGGGQAVHCDASRIGIGCIFLQEGRVIAYASCQLKPHEKNYPESSALIQAKGYKFEATRWLDLLKDYYITILYYPEKADMVADTLSRKTEIMGSITFIPARERSLAFDVQALANKFVRLDVSEPSRVLACVVSHLSLFERIKTRQYDDRHFLVLKEMVHHGDANEVTIGDDGY